MKHTAFHWPDHVIGKRESRAIREAHNALYNSHAELLTALRDLQKQVHAHVQFNVRKHYSLMVADVAASKALAEGDL